MDKRRLLVAGIVALALGVVFGGTAAAQADQDCANFASQADAQSFFDSAGPGDPHGLDSDDDGYACENLPGPYTFGFSADQADEVDTMPSTGTGGFINASNFSNVSWLLVPMTLVLAGGLILGGFTLRRQSI